MKLVGKTTTQRHKDATRKARNQRHYANQKRRRDNGESTEGIGPKLEPFDREAQIRGLQSKYEALGLCGVPRKQRQGVALYIDRKTKRKFTVAGWSQLLGISTDYVRVIATRKGEQFGVRLERAA